MRSFELKDTDENIYETLASDSLSRNLYLYRFIELLYSFEESASIALNGRWGTGKTFFVKQLKLLLEAENGFFEERNYHEKVNNISSWINYKSENNIKIEPYLPIYYDAWLNDNAIDPILSIVLGIINQFNLKPVLEGNPNLLKAVKSVLNIFNKKVDKYVPDEVLHLLEGKNYLDDVNEQSLVHNLVDEFFYEVLLERGYRLVIFIDELDRCRPDYAVTLLERIKHYFTNKKVIYVFSINNDELQHTIKRFYGNGFNATEYLDKFFDLTIDIPLIDVNLYFNYINFDVRGPVFDICKAVVSKLDLSMRQVEHFSKLVKIAIYNNKTYNKPLHAPSEYAKDFMMTYIGPLLIGLRLADADKYRKFIMGKDSSLMIEIYCGENKDLPLGYIFNNKERTIHTVPVIKDRLLKVYDAIFNFESFETLLVNIGEMEFDDDSKGWLLNITNLFSLQIDFN